MQRCAWVTTDRLYIRYHDEEWGVPIYQDQKLFEFLVLESAQAGLSWLTVLRKRENYRAAFANFDYRQVAKFDAKKVTKLLNDPGIVRNRLKILAAINNAQRFIEVREEFKTFSDYLWSFVGGKPIVRWPAVSEKLPATSPESDLLSNDLKRRGFKFIGSTIIFAYMQAVGMVNDHLVSCSFK